MLALLVHLPACPRSHGSCPSQKREEIRLSALLAFRLGGINETLKDFVDLLEWLFLNMASTFLRFMTFICTSFLISEFLLLRTKVTPYCYPEKTIFWLVTALNFDIFFTLQAHWDLGFAVIVGTKLLRMSFKEKDHLNVTKFL